HLGLSLLQGVVPTDEPWVTIVDASIDVAIQKVLVVLRVPLSALTIPCSILHLLGYGVVHLVKKPPLLAAISGGNINSPARAVGDDYSHRGETCPS
ncbi:MAG: hypothetical protein MUF54_09705, partial [Polyangiaceae bacterium]|nr:hypothetical protein [Polyangiaceae bacterium]